MTPATPFDCGPGCPCPRCRPDDDFARWLSDFVRSGEAHAILPGRFVHLAALPSPLVLTAQQAFILSARLLVAAGVAADEPVIVGEDQS